MRSEMKRKMQFDFHELAHTKLLEKFSSYKQTQLTIPIREINRLYGLLFSLKKGEIRALLEDLEERYNDVKLNVHGVKIR